MKSRGAFPFVQNLWKSHVVRSTRLRLAVKINDEYKDYKSLPSTLLAQQGAVGPARPKEARRMITAGGEGTFQALDSCTLSNIY